MRAKRILLGENVRARSGVIKHEGTAVARIDWLGGRTRYAMQDDRLDAGKKPMDALWLRWFYAEELEPLGRGFWRALWMRLRGWR